MILYLSVEQVLELHAILVDAFGGAAEIRDRGGLESAVARPAMTFGGEDLYPDLAAKAAALLHSIVLNHPFVDGNKRAGSAASELMVLLNGHVLGATDDEMEQVTMSVARGEMDIEPLTIWLRQRIAQSD
ncbi:MAG TPA: type II toxin-antitoxin system death-on-curing family toxin [Vicinamibacteria bacterium]|nr:type II toxin-antitoxin system death-on-curing family toxin [Vicinamibacteria bacterium]